MSDKASPLDGPGRRWQARARDGSRALEYGPEGVFDELSIDDWLHLEQMDDRLWWIRVGDAEILVRIEANGSATVDVVRGSHGPVQGTTGVYPTEP
jgi:hypothetical protein